MGKSITKALFEVSTEVIPLPGSEMPDGCVGAFVFSYVPAQDIREAIDRACSTLDEDRYEVIDIDHVFRIDLEEWVPHDDDHPTTEDLGQALKDDEVLYGPFFAYESRYEH